MPRATPGRPAGKARAKAAEVAKRRDRAVQLRIAGATYDQIARQLGYTSKGAAHVDITRAYEENTDHLAESVEVARTIELERLDKMQAAAWRRAMADDDAAILSVLRIMARRAKLLGLDASARLEERRLELAEHQGEMLVKVIRAVVGDLDLTPEQQALVAEAVPRHLRLVGEVESGA